LLFLSLSFFKNGFAWELKDENSGLINGTRDIFAHFYANRSNNLNFIESYSTEESMRNTKDIIDGIAAQIEDRNSLIIENYKTVSKLNYKRTHNIFFMIPETEKPLKTPLNIFFVYNAKSFKKILAIMNTETFFYQGYYLLVLTKSEENQD
jgi:hypothetical protein